MMNINPIFEALSGIDARHLRFDRVNDNRAAKRHGGRARFAVIAAAAVLTVLIGAAAVIRSGVFFDGNEKMSFNYYAQTDAHFPSEEEILALGAAGENGSYTLTAVPSELFGLYNIEPLLNDEFFTEARSEITLFSCPTQAIVKYTITEKETGKAISIEAQFTSDVQTPFGEAPAVIGGSAEEAYDHYELITLADGSQAFVNDRYSRLISGYNAGAVLCRGGVGFKLRVQNTDINEMKQLLAKLDLM